jgi:hypothetical protein
MFPGKVLMWLAISKKEVSKRFGSEQRQCKLKGF